jgi:hypothetical protein
MTEEKEKEEEKEEKRKELLSFLRTVEIAEKLAPSCPFCNFLLLSVAHDIASSQSFFFCEQDNKIIAKHFYLHHLLKQEKL